MSAWIRLYIEGDAEHQAMTLDRFLAENEGFAETEIARMTAAVEAGGVYEGGGGAQPCFWIWASPLATWDFSGWPEGEPERVVLPVDGPPPGLRRRAAGVTVADEPDLVTRVLRPMMTRAQDASFAAERA